MRRALLAALLVAACAAACRQDMHDQPKIKAQAANPFFPDDRGGRPLIPGTVTAGASVEATA
jgi:nitrous oxide reductase accessory protein NosL